MKGIDHKLAWLAAVIVSVFAAATSGPTLSVAQTVDWNIAVNNATVAPGGTPGARYISYNQPAINDQGIMVFRARSRVTTGEPLESGIYRLDLFGGVLEKMAVRGDTVPEPNNTDINGVLATFNEFPSTPRIDPGSPLAASRGQHQPAWSYLLADGSETRVGTAGIFAWADSGAPGRTGASLLGAAVEEDQVTLTFPWFSVPGTVFGTRFDQFPGSPALSDGRYIVFKGNYTDLIDGLGRTGIYFRDVVSGAPEPFTGLIASSNFVIPNQPSGGTVQFGSTAPPSAANGWVFFTGLDIEEAPTLGGIYRAPISPTPTLQVIAGIGEQVPGEPAGSVFNTFGEGLSVSSDGARVMFWAAWGSETFEKLLLCPTDGRPEIIAFCLEQHPTGFVIEVPVNQGFFVHDVASGTTYPIARTLREGITDFLFHNFSGRVPETGDAGDEELARWRSSATGALSTAANAPSMAAFKASRNGTSGIYLREGLKFQLPLRSIAEVDVTPGTDIDPAAPLDSFVSEVAIERDGFRNDRLAISVGMLFEDPLNPEDSISWAGIYHTEMLIDLLFQDGFEGGTARH
ncbi:MAG: hypothetical protein CVV18_01605 [Gammaproteobacteria bacterium HGW-Gammaproteobacteria-8]|nr:MAG: hypothetical protein CVV18_01605 [Gammaproteobacteria bacterium HGW-Gammaproteobacteria-8]